eukprot:7961434-Pyramimonas_sp.AAC.1
MRLDCISPSDSEKYDGWSDLLESVSLSENKKQQPLASGDQHQRQRTRRTRGGRRGNNVGMEAPQGKESGEINTNTTNQETIQG